jgi:hypothetical protein
MRRLLVGVIGGVLATILSAGPVLACGGLVAPNGSVNLVRTTTLAAYVDGVEHYVTSFEFTGGGGGKFGSIVPLPDVPTDVKKSGRWTLQRLVQEVQPPVSFASAAGSERALRDEAEVLLETRVSALDITVLKGGGDAVGNWARANGFSLPPDAPEVLDFYAERSPIFMAVRFNLKRAEDKELSVGDGIPVQVTIPTDQPWVPLRILGLGRDPNELIEADVFLLTEDRPALLPQATADPDEQGLVLERSERASQLLLADLRSDRGMEWLPAGGMWLDYIRINTPAGRLDHDLAISVTDSPPSPVDAGFDLPSPGLPLPNPGDAVVWWPWAAAAIFGVAFIAATNKLGSTRR